MVNQALPPLSLPLPTRIWTGIAWFLASIALCLLNDVIVKAMGNRLPFYQMAFMRFFISALLLVPSISIGGIRMLHTKWLSRHLFRGIGLATATCLWFNGLHQVPLTTATAISFSIPLFIIIFARFFLQEAIGYHRSIATLLGFIGVICTLNLGQIDIPTQSLILVVATAIYAALDVVNKSMVGEESMLNMLFYSGAIGSLCLAPMAYMLWVNTTYLEVIGLLSLGACANLILYCIVKAYQVADVSYLAPWHYVEMMLSVAFGFLCFGEFPQPMTILGATIILGSICWMAKSEL